MTDFVPFDIVSFCSVLHAQLSKEDSAGTDTETENALKSVTNITCRVKNRYMDFSCFWTFYI